MRADLQQLRIRLQNNGDSTPENPLRRRLGKLVSPKSPTTGSRPGPLNREGLADLLDGRWKRRPSGQTLTVTRDFPEDYPHGNSRLAELGSLSPELVCLLANDRAFATFHTDTVLFMDTETTGLAGGAGTYVFLVGIGFFEQTVFRTQQFFLPSPQLEQAFLEELTEALEKSGRKDRFQHLVSFNGKSYDLNLLDNRFVLQRLQNPFRRFAHLDLLHPSRFLWQGCFSDCRLQTLEEELLGFQRSGDIPSALIPRTYFDFLHSGNHQPFEAVLEHNRLDLLSMVVLLMRAGLLVQQPSQRDGVDPVTASRLYQRSGLYQEAVALLEDSSQQASWQENREDILLQLFELKKKLGETDDVLRLTYQIIDEHPIPPSLVFEEAAKILEHGHRQLDSALQLTDRALKLYPKSPSLLHRRHRLACRLAGKKWY